MKFKFIFILLFITSIYAQAQEEEISKARIKEFGLGFSDFDNFNIVFRTGTENSLWRFRSAIVNASSETQIFDNNQESLTTNFRGLLYLGREWRKSISENLQFRYGLDLGYDYGRTYRKTESEDNILLLENTDTFSSIGFRMVFGAIYQFNDHIVFGLEALPGLNLLRNKRIEYNPNRFGDEEEHMTSEGSSMTFNLSNNNVLLSLAYRF